MLLYSDSDLADFWTLRVFLFKGPNINDKQFNSISHKVIQKFSSIPLESVEKTVTQCQYVSSGAIPGLTSHSFKSAFQQNSLNCSTVELSFLLDKTKATGTDEWKSLQISRQVVGVLCIDSLDPGHRPLIKKIQTDDSHHSDSNANMSITNQTINLTNDNGEQSTNAGRGEMEASQHRKVQHSRKTVDAVLEKTRDLKGKVLSAFPFAKVFQAVYLRRLEDPVESQTTAQPATEEAPSNEAKMLAVESWLYDFDDYCFDEQYDNGCRWMAAPIHHFVCRLVLLITKTIKKVLSSPGTDIDHQQQQPQPVQGPKSLVGKAKKRVSDLHLLLGLPLPALSYFHECTELFRSSGDLLWLAGSLESEASALRLYDLRYLEADVAAKTSAKRLSAQGGNLKAASASQTSLDIPLPIEIESLSRDAPKRWGFSLLGTQTQQESTGHSDSDVSPNKMGQKSSSSVLATSANRHCSMAGGPYNRSFPNRSLLIDMILSRLKEALQLYLTTSLVLAVECSLRYSRFLSFLGERFTCLESLNRLTAESKALSSSDSQCMLIGCATICDSIGFFRHAAFYRYRAAVSHLEHSSGSPAAAQRLLLFDSSCYSLDCFGLVQYWKFNDQRASLSSPSLFTGNRQILSITEAISVEDPTHTSQLHRMLTKRPLGFHLPISALRSLARDISTPGSLSYRCWNLSPDRNQVPDFFMGRYRSLYCQSSLDVLRNHAQKQILTPSKTGDRLFADLVWWPTLQLLILEHLRRASDRCSDYKFSLYVSFVTLSLLHSAMDYKMQSTILNRISSTASKLSSPWSLPTALTIIPEIADPPTVKPRPRRHSAVSHRYITRPLSRSPIVIGGVGKGYCQPIPHLISLDVIAMNTPIMTPNSTTITPTVNMELNNFASSTTAIDNVVRQRKLDFIRCRSSPKSSPSDNHPPRRETGSSLDVSQETPVFLFSPWKGKTQVNHEATGQNNKQQSVRYWVANELQSVRVTLENPLVVDLVLDQVQVMVAGGLTECHPSTLCIPSALGSPDHSTVTPSRVTCDLNLIPKEPCQLHFFGLRYSISQVDSNHLILRNTNNLQSYFAKAVREEMETSDEAEELAVLKNSSFAFVEVIDDVPQLVGKLQKVFPNRTCPVYQTPNSPAIEENIPPEIDCFESCGFLDEDIYVDLDHPIPSLIHGEQCSLVLCLSNSSSTRTEYIQIVLLYDVSVSVDSWFRHVTSDPHPSRFFPSFDDDYHDSQSPSPLSNSTRKTLDVPFSFSPIPSAVMTAATSAASPRKIKPSRFTCSSLSFEHVGLSGGETLRVPLQCLGTTGLTECAAFVRYYSSADALHERFLMVPVRLDLDPIPPVYLNRKAMDILPFLPFDDRSAALRIIESSSSHYSIELRKRLHALYEGVDDSDAAATKPVYRQETLNAQDLRNNTKKCFDHPTALLSLEVHNPTPYTVVCSGSEHGRIPTIKIQPHSTVRWMLPIDRECEDNQEQFLSERKSDTQSKRVDTTSESLSPFSNKSQFHIIESVIHGLVWSHVRGRKFPLYFPHQVSVNTDIVADRPHQPSDESPKIPSLSAQALERLKHPSLSLRCFISGGNSDQPHSTGSNLRRIPVNTSIILQIFATPFLRSTTPTSSPAKECEKGKNEEWHFFVLPYEAIGSQLNKLHKSQQDCALPSIELLWSPTLERRIVILEIPEQQLVHEVTLIGATPGTQTIYIGGINLITNEVLWHAAPVQLTFTSPNHALID